jgi:hypothetical protein
MGDFRWSHAETANTRTSDIYQPQMTEERKSSGHLNLQIPIMPPPFLKGAMLSPRTIPGAWGIYGVRKLAHQTPALARFSSLFWPVSRTSAGV